MIMKHFIILCAGVAFACSASVASAAIEGEVNRWTFDEGTGRSTNDSIGGQNGIMTGESSGFGWASGKVGTGIGIDGKDGLSIVVPNGIFSGNAGTISVWLKVTTASDRNIVIGAKSVSDHNVYSLLRIDREGRIEFISKAEASGTERRAQATKLLNVGEWYHVVFIANGVGYKVYVNGQESGVLGDNIGRWWSQISNHSYAYRFGASEAPSRPGVFDGYLDDIRVFSRELTASEVAALYTEGNEASPTVPAAIAPAIVLTTSDTTVPFGGSVMLRWNGTNVDSCTASGSWNGAKAVNGEEVHVKIGSASTYTLSCSGRGGMASASVSVAIGTSTAPAQPASTTGGSSLTVEDVTPPSTQASSGSQTMTSTSAEIERVNTIRLKIIELLMKIIELQKQLNALKAAQ
ncbi:MAG TPA: LamG domain-containing protein [Candidatus Paceibacterota bacterium]|nr:LamG domain-containing protein [Candidatus Paceibacterota bacterium]